MMFVLAIIGLLQMTIGFLFLLGGIGGRATAMFTLGHSSLTFKAAVGAVFIFTGSIIIGMSSII